MLRRFHGIFLGPQPPAARGWLRASSLLGLVLLGAIGGLAPGDSSADSVYSKNGLMPRCVVAWDRSSDP